MVEPVTALGEAVGRARRHGGSATAGHRRCPAAWPPGRRQRRHRRGSMLRRSCRRSRSPEHGWSSNARQPNGTPPATCAIAQDDNRRWSETPRATWPTVWQSRRTTTRSNSPAPLPGGPPLRADARQSARSSPVRRSQGTVRPVAPCAAGGDECPGASDPAPSHHRLHGRRDPAPPTSASASSHETAPSPGRQRPAQEPWVDRSDNFPPLIGRTLPEAASVRQDRGTRAPWRLLSKPENAPLDFSPSWQR